MAAYIEGSNMPTTLRWSRKKLAWYYDCPIITIATWDCRGKHISNIKDGREVFYLVTDIIKFTGAPISKQPLFNTEKAASHIKRSPKSLATWRIKNLHELNPVYINGLVRYRVESLDLYLLKQTMPF
ncbi:hypothetical protein [Ferruginibacter albus]|uniref:hypothetical protein n=1 Tax=Ferruginibacter albus TaxID=2875540 RepID=UPI001CC50450|nr:hypothetical protein [Ferruginibacter albus]UAY53194.1 hypothetical protein K9M53_05860 [Ferruginibacter albus]